MRRAVIIDLFVVVLLSLVLSVIFNTVDFTLGEPGTEDFVQYWAAWQLLQEGLNPYDAGLMNAIQQTVGQKAEVTTMMWNPPWTVLLMSPILWLPFSKAALAFSLAAILLVCLIAVLTPVALGKTRPNLLVSAVVTICFYPMLECLQWGQLSIIMTAAAVLFLIFERRRMFFSAGIALLPLTFKSHLFFLFVIPAAIWLWQLSRDARRSFLCGVIGGFSILIGITALLWPQALAWWIVAITTPPAYSGAVPLTEWQTTTISTLVRISVSSVTGATPEWPMWVVPMVSFILTIMFFYRYRGPINWSVVAPTLLCLSLTTGSYGWLYDHSLLVICQIALVCDAISYSRRVATFSMLILIGLLQIAALVVGTQAGHAQHHFVWLPWAMLLLLILNGAVLRRQKQACA